MIFFITQTHTRTHTNTRAHSVRALSQVYKCLSCVERCRDDVDSYVCVCVCVCHVQGIRANMRRSYALEPVSSDEFFESCSKPGAFKKLLFGLIYFHAVIQVGTHTHTHTHRHTQARPVPRHAVERDAVPLADRLCTFHAHLNR